MELASSSTSLSARTKDINAKIKKLLNERHQRENQKWPSLCADFDLENDFPEDRWIFRNSQQDRKQESDACAAVKPSARDIVRRLYAILPYFDKDHMNTAFLHKFRGTIYSMSDSEDMLDREAGFYAAVLTPLVFLQQYRDSWCLLERFHRAIRLYQISHPTEKRSALKLLQNLRAVNQKIRGFIFELPGPEHPPRTTSAPDDDEETLHDKKDIKYLKELIKNLGVSLTRTASAPDDDEKTLHDKKYIKYLKELIKNLGVSPTRTASAPDDDEKTLHDKKDIKYLKELIKNLGVSPTRTASAPDDDEKTLHDKKDIKYLKELIKNLGVNPPRTTSAPDDDETTLHDKKDMKYLKELTKNLGVNPPRTTSAPDDDEKTLHDKKDIKYLKELIKNLG